MLIHEATYNRITSRTSITAQEVVFQRNASNRDITQRKMKKNNISINKYHEL